MRNTGNEDEVDFRGGNVHVITSKSDWEQKIAEANKDGKIVSNIREPTCICFLNC